MSVKEPINESNPPIVTTGGFIASAARKRSLSDYFALAIATCGVGYLPVAPGTWGSAFGVGIYLLLHQALVLWFTSNGVFRWGVFSENTHVIFAAVLLVIVLVITLAGVWAATRVERLQGSKDPGKVVIDEVAGQLITFLFIPYFSPWWVLVAGFFLFRAFDIWKPYPIRRLESLEAGLGIMADDVLAGLYAATVLALISIFLVL
jgi:phosphatidylglycerophosphatase A